MGCGASAENSKVAPAADAPKEQDSTKPSVEPWSLEGGQVLFIAGFPSSGKTFMGDYLATRGWIHVDGDLIANPQAKAMGGEEKAMAFWAAMQKAFKGETVEKNEWMPYYDLLIDLTKKAREENTNKNVVLSYAVLGVHGGERAIFKQHFPQMKFINVKVDHAELIDRFWKRHEKMKEEAGFTDQQYWDYHEMDEARKEYGPIFSKENMTKFMEKTVYNPKLIDIPATEPDCFEINNNDMKSKTGFEELNKIAGLEWKEVDVEAIAAVNYERYKAMGGGGGGESGGEGDKQEAQAGEGDKKEGEGGAGGAGGTKEGEGNAS